jgi:hypothetical protein
MSVRPLEAKIPENNYLLNELEKLRLEAESEDKKIKYCYINALNFVRETTEVITSGEQLAELSPKPKVPDFVKQKVDTILRRGSVNKLDCK